MDKAKPDIPFLRPGEKVIRIAYLTEEQEIIFAPHSNTTEVVLVEVQSESSGPWAVRIRPPAHGSTDDAAGA
jgi:hypothetical protein